MAEPYNAVQKQFDPLFGYIDNGHGSVFSLQSWKLNRFADALLVAGFTNDNIHTITKTTRNQIIASVGADKKLNKKFKAFITKCSVDGRQ